MKVDVVASLPHYLDHLRPVFDALPDELQGQVYGGSTPWSLRPRGVPRLTLVAGWQDVRDGNGSMVYVEHGAGQSYAGDPKTAHQPGYSASGGARHRGVVGYIAPSEEVARRWRSGTGRPAVAVGCPKLDAYLIDDPPVPEERTICLAWHWDCLISPEARSAWNHYAERLPRVVAAWHRQGWRVFGHSHPRWEGALDSTMLTAGVDEILATDRQVFERAAVLAVDNSSIGMEFQALDRPVIWLDAPWYRRNISHGGRFWDWVIGAPRVSGPDELIELKLNNVWTWGYREYAGRAYDHLDGLSALRAADFVTALATG